jgi:hypothetical protein
MAGLVHEDLREDLRSLFVGERTLGDSFLPPILFVAANAIWSLGWAALAAVAAGVFVGAWRVRKGQQIVYALGGIAAVGFAAFLSVRSGRAETYFLPGIVAAAAWAAIALVSVLVRRPLAAWSSWAFRRWPLPWYWRDDVRPAYSQVTWIWVGYFAVRFLLQWWLFAQGRPELLATAKLATSWPTIIPLLVLSYRVGLAKRRTLRGPSVAEFTSGAPPPFVGGQRGF